MQQKCPYTGVTFQPRRRNQVFVSAKARRDYHNANAAILRKIKAPIDKALEKNFLILSERLNKGETKIFPKEELLMSGFNTSYFTHLDTFNGKTASYLYHFVIPRVDNPNTIQVYYP
jgi:hypothetical protein